jgi:hypothetical protein
MGQYKRVQIIMLPTNKLSSIIFSNTDKKLKLNGRDKFFSGNYQHLYITSDDEIKKGDWYLDLLTNILYKADNRPVTMTCFKKIIATTDTSLTINTYYEIEGNQKVQLPQPSQQFIEKYIECYNKGEVITNVLVEEIFVLCDTNPKCVNCYSKCLLGTKLKVNPKDNTITIKKLKDSWNREELEKIARNAFKAGVDKGIALEIYKTELDNNPKADENFDKIPTENKWIEENL